MDNRIYDLVLNNQGVLKELLNKLEVNDIDEKLKDILNEELYEVVEADGNGIKAIKKKSNGQIFKKGCLFFHKKYGIWKKDMWFDESLRGTKYFDSYYKNYVRGGDGGLYHLNEITLGL